MGMENKNVSPVIGRLGLEARPEFNVVLAYDEIAGGMRAKECFDDLARLHGELFNFNCQLWNFEVIRKPELFEAAAQDAARAKMMLLRPGGARRFPVKPRDGSRAGCVPRKPAATRLLCC
jgi:hypothetical protein